MSALSTWASTGAGCPSRSGGPFSGQAEAGMGTSSTRIALIGLFLIVALTLTLQTTHTAAEEPSNKASNSSTTIKVIVTSILVDDQAKALEFYTKKLGFVKKTDIPMGPARWLTVVSPAQPDGPEVLLEPTGFPPSKTFQKAAFDAGIPWTMFGVDDVAATYERFKKAGVVFRTPPTNMGTATIAMFEDTCGNLIQIAQQ
jgi:predicted enzyme related to lactoylglutathione lyase